MVAQCIILCETIVMSERLSNIRRNVLILGLSASSLLLGACRDSQVSRAELTSEPTTTSASDTTNAPTTTNPDCLSFDEPLSPNDPTKHNFVIPPATGPRLEFAYEIDNPSPTVIEVRQHQFIPPTTIGKYTQLIGTIIPSTPSLELEEDHVTISFDPNQAGTMLTITTCPR